MRHLGHYNNDVMDTFFSVKGTCPYPFFSCLILLLINYFYWSKLKVSFMWSYNASSYGLVTSI